MHSSLSRPDEALGDAVALRFAHVGGVERMPSHFDLGLGLLGPCKRLSPPRSGVRSASLPRAPLEVAVGEFPHLPGQQDQGDEVRENHDAERDIADLPGQVSETTAPRKCMIRYTTL